MPHFNTVPAMTTLALSLWSLGCGEEGTGPEPEAELALVSGVYETTSRPNGPPICTPASALEILETAVGATDTRETVKVEERAGQITLTVEHIELIDGSPVSYDSTSHVVAPIDAEGNVSWEFHVPSHYTLAGRNFFDQLTLSVTGKFDREADPVSVNLSGTGTLVVRENAVDGPVFATCVQSQTTTGTRAEAWLAWRGTLAQ